MRDVREDYEAHKLTRDQLAADPLAQIEQWVDDAIAQQAPLPNAMTLATVDAEGRPSTRTVLLKGVTAQGLTFFTNYASRKGEEIAVNPWVSVTLFWPLMSRQIVVCGPAEKVPEQESRDYFASRPLSSQLSAALSPQSEPVTEAWAVEQERRLTQVQDGEANGETIAMPAHWGGYRIRPHEVQFWHGRPSRLHDRYRYTRQASGEWWIERLAP